MTGSPVPVGPLALATSLSGRNRVPAMAGLPVPLLLGPLAPVLSATAGNSVPAMTGPSAPVPAGPPGSATSAIATGFPISVGHAVPIVAILHFILSRGVSILLEPVLARDRSRSLSVCGCWVCRSSDICRRVKISARGAKGVPMGFWTPHV